MALLVDILIDAVRDTLALVPFLFATYLVLEVLEHLAGERVDVAVRRAGAAGPVVASVLGVVPQCGFSAMGATLYAGRVVTLGTLVAVLLSTSDELLPIFLAEQADIGLLLQILLVKVAVAAVTGLALDVVLRILRGRVRSRAVLLGEFSTAGEGAEHIHELCERDHCGCDDEAESDGGTEFDDGRHGDGHAHDHGDAHDHAHGHRPLSFTVIRSAVSHTVQVSAFIFLVTFVLVAVLDTVGEQALAAFLAGNETLAVFASGLVGLIPNCAASVVITQLYLEGVLSFSSLMAGSLVSVGIGFLVLFRTNRSLRENIAILVLLYVLSVAWGLLFAAFGL